MDIKRCLVIPILYFLIAVGARCDTASLFAKYVPDGVRFGIDFAQLSSARPQLVQVPVSPSGVGKTEYIEPPVHSASPCVYSYLLKNGTLEAVTRSVSMRGKTTEEVNTMVAEIRADLTSSYLKKGISKVVRTNGKSVYLLNAELWESEDHNEAYLVATDQEITLVLFNAAVFGESDFFIGEERKKEFQTMVDAIPRASGTSTFRKPPTDLIPSVLAPQ